MTYFQSQAYYLLSARLEQVIVPQFPHLSNGVKLLKPAYFAGLYTNPLRHQLKSRRHSRDVRGDRSSERDVEKVRKHWVATHSLRDVLGRE